MSEKLNNQLAQPESNIFNKLKTFISKKGTENMNRNLETSATGQTPLKRLVARIEDFVNGESCATDGLRQEIADRRYETARLLRKAEREAKGQTFEEYVNDVVAQKEAAKAVEALKVPQPKPKTNESKSTNSLIDKAKAWAALAVLSTSMMIAPNALAENKSKVEAKNQNPVKVEQIALNQTKTTTETTTSSKLTEEQQIQKINEYIAGKGVANGGIKAGLSFKGLEARFTLRAKHNGEAPTKIIIKVKEQVASAQKLMSQGQSETVAYILTSLESESAKTQKSKDEATKKLSDEKIYKAAIAELSGGKEVKSIEIQILDQKTGEFTKTKIIDPTIIKQINKAKKNPNKTDCKGSFSAYWRSCPERIVKLNGLKYWIGELYWTDYELIPFDPLKPDSYENPTPDAVVRYPKLIKAWHKGKERYFRLSSNFIEKMNNDLKLSNFSYILAVGEMPYETIYDSPDTQSRHREWEYKIIKNQKGEFEILNESWEIQIP